MAKIFISYKRNVHPDAHVATTVYEALRHRHDVFIDTTIQVGEKWAERIQNEIKQCDYLIIFLSDGSVESEMVIAEVETAHHHAKEHGQPTILPVRLAYSKPLVYPLSAYLNPLQWALWDGETDTPRLIEELRRAVSGENLSGKIPDEITGVSTADDRPTPFANLESPEGTMPHQSPFYIERETDHEAIKALYDQKGATITIKGPRQMGKSSLLNRLVVNAREQGMKTAFIDFQLIEKNVLETADIFYRQFCSLLSWMLGVEDRTEEVWKAPLGQLQKTTHYVTRNLVSKFPDTKLLLAVDEAERMSTSSFRSDFFSMLRSWHNARSRDDDLTRINLVLVTSTEPYTLIPDLHQSPFNVGTVVELRDFTHEQVGELNRRHGNPLTAEQATTISELIGGQPYLTRKALYLLSSRRATFEEIVNYASEDQGPFGDHLRNHLFRMSDHPQLKSGMLQVIQHKRCTDEDVFLRLRGAGLVKRVGQDVLPRNSLYAEYFSKRLS